MMTLLSIFCEPYWVSARLSAKHSRERACNCVQWSIIVSGETPSGSSHWDVLEWWYQKQCRECLESSRFQPGCNCQQWGTRPSWHPNFYHHHRETKQLELSHQHILQNSLVTFSHHFHHKKVTSTHERGLAYKISTFESVCHSSIFLHFFIWKNARRAP